ncbi:MAG: protein kinase domain-containing protein, partial [Candidatus Asgardarchaeia archaeon]
MTEEIRKTFVKEISIWSVLQHQNIVRLLDYGIDPVPYIVMECMEGSLRDLLNKKSFQIKEALEIVLQIALALNYAHSEFNLVHRDIKPENILFKGDIFKLSDWGLSKICKHSATS